MKKLSTALLLLVGVVAGCDGPAAPSGTLTPATTAPATRSGESVGKLTLSEDEWARRLTPAQFKILRQHGTDPAFASAFHDYHGKGVFRCVGCDLTLFDADAKFDSGTGWPSFTRPIEAGHVLTRTDTSYGMVRTEVICARCDGHLGHVFEDGPPPTGLRYCINGTALKLEN